MNNFEIVKDSENREYKKLNGTCFHIETDNRLCEILNELMQKRTKVKIVYGDTKTGKLWLEENDVYGTIGRSTGTYKIPLLVPHGSYGGAGLLDNCILRIESTSPNILYWQNPNMIIPKYEITKSDLPEYAENLVIDGEIYSRHRKTGCAKRLAAKLGLNLTSVVNGTARRNARFV